MLGLVSHWAADFPRLAAHFNIELRAAQNIIGQNVALPHPEGAQTIYTHVYPTEMGGFVGIWW